MSNLLRKTLKCSKLEEIVSCKNNVIRLFFRQKKYLFNQQNDSSTCVVKNVHLILFKAPVCGAFYCRVI